MGSYENIVKIEELRRKIEEGDYLSAQKILDTIDRKKIKNLADLGIMAEVLIQNERYDEAMEILLSIYHKTKTRKIVYQMIEVSIKRNNTEEASRYLFEYEKTAPQDFFKYIFRYQIDKLKKEPFETLIKTLETLKKTEYMEPWAYELAKLYYKAGMEEECIKECSDIILWFGEGVFVEKAKMLKAYYSGETDKEKMIEELKRRAKEDRTEREPEEEETYLFDTSQDQTEEYIENEMNSEDDIFETKEFMKEDLIETFTESNENLEEHNVVINGEATEYMPVEEMSLKNNEENFNKITNDLSESEQAEKEVEDAIYSLLHEEDLNEEDRRLKEMSEELGINMIDVFGDFLHIKTIKKQLVKCLDGIMNDRSKSIQMIITGTTNSGKTTLAKDLAVFFYNAGKLKSTKVAKIKADKMNSVDVLSKKETLRDCCLIIENASELKRSTIDDLLELIHYFKGDIIVIFEENKKNMNKLFRECPKLMDLCKNRIHLPQYTPEDLLGFAKASLKQQDYQPNSKALTLLQNKIYQIAKNYEPNKQLDLIQELLQAVKTAADIRIGMQLPSLAKQGRLKDVEILSILPEDFNSIL